MDESDYEIWLDRAGSKLLKVESKKERFEIPKIQHLVLGNRTFIKNFKQICQALRRDEQHVLHFLAKDMATAGNVEGEQAFFQGKFSANLIKHLIDEYVEEYIVCPVCRSPDTNIVKQDRFRFLVCEACGARSSLRTG